MRGGSITVARPHVHSMVKTAAIEATHKKDGNITYYTCSSCNKIFKDQNGNNEITKAQTVLKSPGCDFKLKNDSTKHWYECSCGETKNNENHTFGNWTIVNHATEFTEGLKEASCTICSYKKSKKISVLPHEHKLVKTNAVNATHEENGNIEYWTCSGCGEIYKDSSANVKITKAQTVV